MPNADPPPPRDAVDFARECLVSTLEQGRCICAECQDRFARAFARYHAEETAKMLDRYLESDEWTSGDDPHEQLEALYAEQRDTIATLRARLAEAEREEGNDIITDALIVGRKQSRRGDQIVLFDAALDRRRKELA